MHLYNSCNYLKHLILFWLLENLNTALWELLACYWAQCNIQPIWDSAQGRENFLDVRERSRQKLRILSCEKIWEVENFGVFCIWIKMRFYFKFSFVCVKNKITPSLIQWANTRAFTWDAESQCLNPSSLWLRRVVWIVVFFITGSQLWRTCLYCTSGMSWGAWGWGCCAHFSFIHFLRCSNAGKSLVKLLWACLHCPLSSLLETEAWSSAMRELPALENIGLGWTELA